MTQGHYPTHGSFLAQTESIPSRLQDPNHPVLPPSGRVLQAPHPWYPQGIPDAPTYSGVNEGKETEEDNTQSESDLSETCSQYSTSSTITIASDNTVAPTPVGFAYPGMSWAYDLSEDLVSLEELREDFETELKNPSAWTLQRIAVLAHVSRFGARETVRLWLNNVDELTYTCGEESLQLPRIAQPEDLPFHKPRTWEEVDALPHEDRESYFGQDVEESFKQVARLAIAFLFPESLNAGLSVGEKGRIFAVASTVWFHDQQKAKGLLWVMANEHPHTRDEEYENGWANSMSKKFMIYTVLFPPPIVMVE